MRRNYIVRGLGCQPCRIRAVIIKVIALSWDAHLCGIMCLVWIISLATQLGSQALRQHGIMLIASACVRG